MRLKPSSLTWLGLLFLFTLPAVWPILTQGYFPIHDDTQVVRVAQMTQSLLDGHFPVRWVKDLGYGFGYPIFNFYNPLPYYVGSLFHLIGFSALFATKIMFVLPVFVGSLGMFILMKKYVDRLSALAASLMYTYAPYHAVQIYVRGAVAEYWATAILPFVIYYLLSKKPVGAGISLGLLILAHNLTTLMATGLIAILFVIQLATEKKQAQVWSTYLLSGILGLGLAAFFWLPALAEKHFTNVDRMIQQEFNAVEHFVSPLQLWNSPWGFGGSSPGQHDGLSFMVGKVPILLTIISLLFEPGRILWASAQRWMPGRTNSVGRSPRMPRASARGGSFFAHIKAQRRQFSLYVAALIVLGLSLYMLLPLSQFVWERVNILDVLQFPWRFLSFVSLSTAIIAGFAIAAITLVIKKHLPGNSTSAILAISGLVLFVFFSSVRYFQPQFKFPATDEELLGETKIKLEVSGLSDEYMPIDAKRPTFEVDIPTERYTVDLTGDEQVSVIVDKTQVLSLDTKLNQPKTIVLNIHQFPGWIAAVDDQPVLLETADPYKLMSVNLPTGDHNLTVRLEDTPIRKTANFISLTTLITLCVWGYSRRKTTSLPLLQ